LAADNGKLAGAIIHSIGSVIVAGNSSRSIGYRFTRSTESPRSD
jgi:hypothetical protein